MSQVQTLGAEPLPLKASNDEARLRLLYELGCRFAARVELDELSAEVVARCREVLDAEAAAILLLDAERDELYFPYVADEDTEVGARTTALRFPAKLGLAGAVLRDNRAVRIDDVASDPRFYRGVDRDSGLTTRNLLCAPLRTRLGTIGVVQVLNRRGGCFTDEDLAFLEALAGSIAVAIENARIHAQLKAQVARLEQAVHEHNQLVAIRNELDIARNIQQSILPRAFPEREDLEVAATMVPAREVGGDFYDFFLVDRARLGFVIGDVSGKGVPAALFMAVSRTLLKAIAMQRFSPGDCLRHVNALLCLENSSEMFVSVFYGILDGRTGAIEYANAGHNPPYCLRGSGSLEILPVTGGTVLGVLEDARYETRQARLAPGESIFLYTDGVTEAMDCAGELFSHRLERVLEGMSGGSPAGMVETVVEAVRVHAAAEPQSDDLTVMAIRYRGGGE